MAELAIRRHATRGDEVIEILEMLGGNNKYNFRGDEDEWFILNRTIQRSDRLFDEKGFTLEEFLEKFPYKVGNTVLAYCEGIFAQFTIRYMRWNYELNKIEYKICQSWCDTSLIQPYKEETMEESTNKAIFESKVQSCDMVNKQEFIDKIKKWLELETDWNMEYIEDGRNPNYGKIDELISHLSKIEKRI